MRRELLTSKPLCVDIFISLTKRSRRRFKEAYVQVKKKSEEREKVVRLVLPQVPHGPLPKKDSPCTSEGRRSASQAIRMSRYQWGSTVQSGMHDFTDIVICYV
jgi:hypothetical protein